MSIWLTVTEVAATLHTHPEVVRRWLRQGRLHGVKFGHAWRVAPDTIVPPTSARMPVNVIRGHVRRVDTDAGIAWVATDSTPVAVQAAGLRRGAHARIHLGAADILVSRRRLHGVSARNQWPGVIASMLHQGGGVEVRVATRPPLVAWMTCGAVRELGLRPGFAVVLVFKAGACKVHAEPGPRRPTPLRQRRRRRTRRSGT